MTAEHVREQIIVFRAARIIPRCRPAWYLAYITWLLLLQTIAPLSLPYAWVLQAMYVVVGLSVTAGRMADAGLPRRWAGVALPSLAAPWIFPRVIAGAEPMAAVAQLIRAVGDRNPSQLALASGLIMALVVVGLAPSRKRGVGLTASPKRLVQDNKWDARPSWL